MICRDIIGIPMSAPFSPHIDIDTDILTEHDVDRAGNSSVTSSTIRIYRFEFAGDFKAMLRDFANVHRHDSCADFKEAWREWKTELGEIYENEKCRLEELGFAGDFDKKAFTSARYYFRNKGGNGTRQKETTTRRKYTTLGSEFLRMIDAHIQSEIHRDSFTPAVGYTRFYEENYYYIERFINGLTHSDTIGEQDGARKAIDDRIKKTYKNRHYLMSRKMAARVASDNVEG